MAGKKAGDGDGRGRSGLHAAADEIYGLEGLTAGGERSDEVVILADYGYHEALTQTGDARGMAYDQNIFRRLRRYAYETTPQHQQQVAEVDVQHILGGNRFVRAKLNIGRHSDDGHIKQYEQKMSQTLFFLFPDSFFRFVHRHPFPNISVEANIPPRDMKSNQKRGGR